jgi:hypothetical protein
MSVPTTGKYLLPVALLAAAAVIICIVIFLGPGRGTKTPGDVSSAPSSSSRAAVSVPPIAAESGGEGSGKTSGAQSRLEQGPGGAAVSKPSSYTLPVQEAPSGAPPPSS